MNKKKREAFKMVAAPAAYFLRQVQSHCYVACATVSDNLMATFIYTEGSFKVIVNRNRETINAYRRHFEELWKWRNHKIYIHACMHICAITKVISLSDEAYSSLKMLKKEGESFSDVVGKLTSTEGKKDVMEFWGKWPGGVEELDRIEKILASERKKFKLRKVDL